MKDTVIYLTRHGQTEWNREKRLQGRGNSPLTANGIKGAEELRDRIKSLDIDMIYTSPIERAYHTARIVKGDKGVEIKTHEGLVEMAFGAYEGRKIDDLLIENTEWNIDLIMKGNIEMRAPDGETLGEVRERVKQAMDSIIETHRGETILIVAHGLTLKAIMHYFKDEEVNNEVMGQTTLTKVEVGPDDISKIIFKNDGTHFTSQGEKLGW